MAVRTKMVHRFGWKGCIFQRATHVETGKNLGSIMVSLSSPAIDKMFDTFDLGESVDVLVLTDEAVSSTPTVKKM